MSQYKSQIQNMFLSQARKKHQKIELVLETGTVLRGKLKAYDQFSVTLGFKDQSEVIYKSSIIYITILPPLRPDSYDRKGRNGYRDDSYRRNDGYRRNYYEEDYDDESDEIDYEENTKALNSYRKLGDDSFDNESNYKPRNYDNYKNRNNNDSYYRRDNYRKEENDSYKKEGGYRKDNYRRTENDGYRRDGYRRNDSSEGYRRDNNYRRNDNERYKRDNNFNNKGYEDKHEGYQKPYYRKKDDDYSKPLTQQQRRPYPRKDDDDDPPPPKKYIVKRY